MRVHGGAAWLAAALVVLGLGSVDGIEAPARAAQDRSAAGQPDTGRRPVAPGDLLALRTVDAVRISPDGRHIAFQVHWANPETNSYTAEWRVVGTAPGSRPVRAADAGDARFVRMVASWLAVPPVWAPGSRSFAFLRKHAGAVQLWLFDLDRGAARQLVHDSADVEDAVWSRDGHRLLFSTGLARADARAAAAALGRSGVLLDGSVRAHWWRFELEPDVIAAQTERIRAYDLESGRERPATSGEVHRFRAHRPPMPADLVDAYRVTPSPDGRRLAYTGYEAESATAPEFPTLFVRGAAAGGRVRRLAGPDSLSLLGFDDITWDPSGKVVYYTKVVPEEGRRVVFAVADSGGPPGRVARTGRDESFSMLSVDSAGTIAAGVLESPTDPPDVAVLDLRTGAVRTLTNLNPQWHHLVVQPASLITWTNRLGHLAFGHLVKPVGYVSGRRYPLVITTYRSDGFLRGAVGDEYPIQVFAANGLMVLSYGATYDSRASRRRDQSFDSSLRGWTSPTASLEAAVRMLSDSGLVDSTRVGLTGLSYGAEITTFAITHSTAFQTAIESGCNYRDPIAFWMIGDSATSYFGRWQLGLPSGPTAPRWRRLSPALNAERAGASVLVNVSEHELTCELQLYTTLKTLGKPVELYVYPDEWHNKTQPAHRLAIYRRNVDWMNYWLRDSIDAAPAKRPQYRRWAALRARWEELRRPGPGDSTGASGARTADR